MKLGNLLNEVLQQLSVSIQKLSHKMAEKIKGLSISNHVTVWPVFRGPNWSNGHYTDHKIIGN